MKERSMKLNRLAVVYLDKFGKMVTPRDSLSLDQELRRDPQRQRACLQSKLSAP